ncbi:MAG TPA: DNA polymerase III subunit delta' [Methylocystis sp.]|nr:DNA polymerase III subunit delta' [Methylocystis sp.]
MRKPEAEEAPESDAFEGAPHPRCATRLIGQAGAEQEMLSAYRDGRLAHAWLIGGPEGVGKATLAWRFARFLLAHPDPKARDAQEAASLFVPGGAHAARQIAGLATADIHLLRRGWNDKTKKFFTEIRIDEVREVIDKMHRASGMGGWRIVIVDSADDLNRSSANALLKLIEEPPERALFLLVAHQPGRVLPTIRSRCRRLLLEPMQPGEIATAVRALGPPFASAPEATLSAAAEASEGSVREALRLLDEESLAFDSALKAMFERLPQVEWSAVHALADRLAGYENEAAFETFLNLLYRFLDARVRAGAEQGADRLIGYATAWEEITEAVRETQVFNFDRRALVLGIFLRLEKAAQA